MEVAQAKSLFLKTFGPSDGDIHVVSAPGRVNLIGEHTDYNEGFVMPFCISQKTVIVGRRVNGTMCRAVSAQSPDLKVEMFPGTDVLKPKGKHWSNYMRGVVKQYLRDCGGTIGFDVAVYSSVPLGGGVSSSASLEVATATFIESIYNLTANPQERALRCQKAEHEFAGVMCGIMDQFISSCGKEGNVLLIDCRPPYNTTSVPLNDPSVSLVVTNSNVKHELVGTEYSDRVMHCQDAARQIAATFPDVTFLRDATLDMLEEVKSELTEVVYNRAYHGISEDERTQAAVTALQQRDYDVVGKLMLESHESLRANFEVSCAELDTLVELAMNVPGVYGSRMTGGGFGGCTVTLVQTDAVEALTAALEKGYSEAFPGKEATVFCTSPQVGAKVLDVNTSVQKEKDKCSSMMKVIGAIAVLGLGYYAYKKYSEKK